MRRLFVVMLLVVPHAGCCHSYIVENEHLYDIVRERTVEIDRLRFANEALRKKLEEQSESIAEQRAQIESLRNQEE